MSARYPTRLERHGRRFRITWWSEGRRFRRTFDAEEPAAEFLQLLQADRRSRARARIKGALTLGEVVANWYREHRADLSSGTRRDYEGRIRRDVARIGSTSAEELARNPRDSGASTPG